MCVCIYIYMAAVYNKSLMKRLFPVWYLLGFHSMEACQGLSIQ